jgi:hypothetical protein
MQRSVYFRDSNRDRPWADTKDAVTLNSAEIWELSSANPGVLREI